MKLNRKGFTLVELLAVIIILAIVVGITIPAIMTSVNDARKSGFQTAANTAADWLERQAQSYAVGDKNISPVDSVYETNFIAGGSYVTEVEMDTNSANFADVIKAAGLQVKNISAIKATYSNGRYCVELTASTDGDYKNQTAPAKSANCA